MAALGRVLEPWGKTMSKATITAAVLCQAAEDEYSLRAGDRLPVAGPAERPAAQMLLIAVVLLGVLPGTPTVVRSQESGGGSDGSRLGEVERRVGDAEDVIVEEVHALRRRMETLETRLQALEAELAVLRRTSPP